MSRIEIPKHLVSNIGNELKMDFHAIDVRLKASRTFPKLAVKAPDTSTGREGDLNGWATFLSTPTTSRMCVQRRVCW